MHARPSVQFPSATLLPAPHVVPYLPAGLLCLATARTGGQSSWCSSAALYNEMLRRDPALVHTLLEPLYVDRKGEIPEGKLPHYQMAVFHWFEVRLLHVHLRNSLNVAQDAQLSEVVHQQPALRTLHVDFALLDGMTPCSACALHDDTCAHAEW